MNMCLAIPGQILRCEGDEVSGRIAQVSFGGVVREVSLAFVPEADINDYVLVHVGFAIAKLDRDEAERVLAELKSLGESETES
jgi:hydrogenase expression/formation protein HypC